MPTGSLADDSGSPWHAGELALQRRVGVVKQMDEHGRRVVRDHLIDQHREFYPLIPFVALGAVDADGDAWATLLAGEPGFMQAPTPHTLRVNAIRDPDDPASAGIYGGSSVALVGVELHTRRRNRLNGVVQNDTALAFEIGVRQSYGNCNRYIQARRFEFVRAPAVAVAPAPEHRVRLDARAGALIAAADTVFVASYVDRSDGIREVDVSHRGGAMPLRWTLPADGFSPYSTMTGSWEESAQRMKAIQHAHAWRPFRITKIVDESSVIRSFHLEPADRAGVIPHLAGQHLPIRVTRATGEAPLIRTYTLSVAPSDGFYRISVKRDGVVSRYLHDVLHEGDLIEARTPAGNFTIDALERRPAVLLAGGVGVTPMLAMLRHLVVDGTVAYREPPSFDVAENEALICCAVPAAADGAPTRRLMLDL